MKKYFYSNGQEKTGPVSHDELKQAQGISKETLIWFEGLDDWTPAMELEEIKSILGLQPPPINTENNDVSHEPVKEIVTANENLRSQSRRDKKGMFSNPFSFDGRIRRTEYGLSNIIYFFVYAVLISVIDVSMIPFLQLPLLWFYLAQGAKRCHDLGNSGWWQLIPFYGVFLLFQNSEPGVNKYGYNPKA